MAPSRVIGGGVPEQGERVTPTKYTTLNILCSIYSKYEKQVTLEAVCRK
jgi:hypothetical protein